MAAATNHRWFEWRPRQYHSFPVKAGETVYQGTFVGEVNGEWVPLVGGAADANAKRLGIVDEQAMCGCCPGGFTDKEGNVRAVHDHNREYGPFANSAAADELTNNDRDSDVFAVDNQTLAKTNGGAAARRAIGKLTRVTSEGVWFRFES